MRPIRRVSIAGQVVGQLREELRRERWRGRMPGVIRLASDLAVSRTSVEAALRQLESEGLLIGNGPGRSRLVVSGSTGRESGALGSLRVGILLHDTLFERKRYIVELQHELEAAGHSVLFARKSQSELNSDLRHIRRQVDAIAADAWVVVAGSHPVLEWFSALPVPSLALFGRPSGLAIAATKADKVSAYAVATQELTGLGHRRIVLLCRRLRRLPVPGRTEQAFLDELERAGVPVGEYNLPDWVETIDGFHSRLDSLFRSSPPTALIIDEPPLFSAAQQFLAERGIRVPRDVSLVCADADASFTWCRTAVSHIRWDSRPVIRRIVRWAAAVSRNRVDLKQVLYPSEFVRGGTIGPVREG